MAGPERPNMAEASAPELPPPASAVELPEHVGNPQAAVHVASNYDPNRKDYQSRTEGRHVSFIDPLTGQEVARVPKVEGGAGVIPSAEFASFDPTTITDPKLRPIADQIRKSGDTGIADEGLMNRLLERIERLIDNPPPGITEAFANESEQLIAQLDGWRIRAEQIVSPENVRQPSLFEQTLFNIANLQNLPDSQDKIDQLQQEITRLNELMKRANETGLFQAEKHGLYDLFRMGRIDVSIRERREGSKFRHISDMKARLEQTSVESEVFWNDPRYPQRKQLRAELGGSVDYFVRGSAALINLVVKNPRGEDGSLDIHADRDYSDIREDYAGIDGIIAAWQHRWVNGKGAVESSNNFEDMRKKLEQERVERPRFMKHPWYHSVEFFADNMYELGLATRDFVKYAIANLSRGESKVMLQNLQQEQGAGQSAYADAILFFERKAEEPTVMWTSSEMNSAFSMAGIGFFQRLGGKGVEGFQYFANSWAEGLRKTDTSVNYEDALTLDEDGMFLYIAEKLCENDGEFWRFGSNSPQFLSKDEIYEYLDRKRAEIIEDAASHRLRSIGDPSSPNYLLKTFDADDAANPLTFIGSRQRNDPFFKVQELFVKLKAKFDEIDAETVRSSGTVTRSRWDIYVEQNRGNISIHRAFAQAKASCDLKDAQDILEGKTIIENRWGIFKKEAKRWEDFAKFGKEDLRDPKSKVKFVHPLARILNDEEFKDMYEQISATEERRERARYLIKRVEDYLRFNMIDVRSGSARIKFRKKGPDGHPIRNGEVEEVKVYTNVLRDELKSAMALDENRPPLDKRFKVTYILRKMGYQPEMPAYGMFTLGADDTTRNESIEKHFKEEPEFKTLFDEVARNKEESEANVANYKIQLKNIGKTDAQIEADETLKDMLKLQKFVNDRLFRGSNAKTIIVKFTEDERIAVQAVQRAIRHPDNKKYGNGGGDYENFPGYDIDFEEGGVKFWKNHLYPDYGTSRGTVRTNGMIPFMNFGVLDRISELGGWKPKYITGLRHRGDEIELAEEGTLLIDPKDTQDYLTRLESIIKKRSLWTSVGNAEKKPGAMMGGFFSGMFKLRELGTRSEYFTETFIKEISKGELPHVIQNPEAAVSSKFLKESGKRVWLETISAAVGPLEAIMRANLELETGYGYAQGTAKNMNTFLINDIFYWMDNFWNEYKEDYSFAVDGMLYMARYFMYGYLEDEGLIWPALKEEDIEGWKEISERLIKDLPEDLLLGVPVGSRLYPEEGSIKMPKGSVYLTAPTQSNKREEILAKLRA